MNVNIFDSAYGGPVEPGDLHRQALGAAEVDGECPAADELPGVADKRNIPGVVGVEG